MQDTVPKREEAERDKQKQGHYRWSCPWQEFARHHAAEQGNERHK
jgi:hypothetical protein